MLPSMSRSAVLSIPKIPHILPEAQLLDWQLWNMPGRTTPSTTYPVTVRTRHRLPAVWMRAGTSKGLFLHRRDLPTSTADWAPIITQAMGCDARQLDGLGGATSTTSKVAVVSTSIRPDADIDYTFVQVPIGGSTLDMTGNCGNIASGVGPFAVDEGLVKPEPGAAQACVRVYNTNTDSVVLENFPVDSERQVVEDGDLYIPGLTTKGSPVSMTFVQPAGAMTGTLLPTGRPSDVLHSGVRISAVDAGNPFVLVDGRTLPLWVNKSRPYPQESLQFMESLRRQVAVLMGLASSEDQAAKIRGTPKIAILSPSDELDVDLVVTSFSMGTVHGSLQLTGAVCIATAACTRGTIACEMRPTKTSLLKTSEVVLRHPGGKMPVKVTVGDSGDVDDVTVVRTARRLMEGVVYYLN